MEHKLPAWSTQTFEFAFGLLLVGTAASNLLGWLPLDPFESVIPLWLLWMFSASYALAGLLIAVGLVASRGDIEGAGLVLLIPMLGARAILYGSLLGWGVDAYLTLYFCFIFSAAAAIRVVFLVRS